MLNHDDIADALVLKLQSIEALVTAIGGADHISAHVGVWPSSSYFQAAFVEMKPPFILVVWRDTSPGDFGAAQAWKHTFSLLLRAPEDSTADFFSLIVNGVPVDLPLTAAQVLLRTATGAYSKSVTDAATGGIALNAALYVHGTTSPTITNVEAGGSFYGYALATVADGQTAMIGVFHVQSTGTPAAQGGKLLNETIHPGCYPMDPPSCSLQTLMVTAEASIDYPEAKITLTEIGDN
jgi:hypothetical protein